MKNKKNVFLTLIIIIFAVIFTFAAVFLVMKYINISDDKNEYSEIASSYSDKVDKTEATASTEITAPAKIDVQLAENPVDFATLKSQNNDIYSWIYIPNTNINYPVCQSALSDNFYLDHDIYKNYSFAGTIYSQYCNKRNYTDRVTVLYGHNMANGSMFADLHKFSDTNFFNKNKYIYIYTPDRKLTYEIVSAFIYDDRHIMNSFDFTDDKVFSEYLDTIQNPRSVSKNVNKEINLTIDDKILVLSTCLNSGEGRYLVQGVLVNDEKTKWWTPYWGEWL